MSEKELFFQDFNNSMHRLGRATLVVMTALLLAVPFIYGAANDVSPDWAGFLSGLAFRALQHKNQLFATVVAAVICPVINTGLFLIGTLAVFRPLLEQWAAGWMEATGNAGASLGTYLIVGMVGLNFLVELGINVVLSPVVVRILKIRKAA